LPFPHVNPCKFIRARNQRDVFPIIISAVCIGLDIARHFTTKEFGTERLWSFQPQRGYVLALAWVANLVTLGVPLRLWNNTRLEMLLKSQENLAVRAKLDALTQQINPHFLFNTLTSISAATRRNPELARDLIQKLSMILRRVLYRGATFVALREELEYIDSYLDIEVSRFGSEKLRVVKQVDPGTEDVLVPSMILQPLVENAINHAIAPRPTGGTVWIRVSRQDDQLEVEIADDGAGFDPSRLDLDRSQASSGRRRRGIGLANVHQRLEMAYGHGLHIDSARGRSTRIVFQVPYVATSQVALQTEEVGA